MAETKSRCASDPDRPALPDSFYDPKPVKHGTVRASKMGKRRAWVLFWIHVAVFLHILHWKLRGETLSPLEPSEAMFTLARGTVNAGAILFLLSIVSVLIVGRFFCGWACHLVAVQDLCAWLLKKVGIRPRPLRSRLLMFVPILAALAMFGMPLLVRFWYDLGLPDWLPGLETSEFWETFPGPWLATTTFVVCGFVMVYLLGAKGFCTYACPYGGIFGVVDRFSPARIRVTDACKGCGHCTATCTSNVQVAYEVARYRAVVDPGCMKCLDCVSVCPEDALYFGFGRPALGARLKKKHRQRLFDFSLGEELALAGVSVLALSAMTGFPEGFFPWAGKLYGVMPLLLSLGIAVLAAFTTVFLVRTIRRSELSLASLSLKLDGRLTHTGRAFLITGSVFLLFIAHSGWVQYHMFRGDHRFRQVDVAALAFRQDRSVPLDEEIRADIDSARRHFSRAGDIGLVDDFRVPARLGGLALRRGRSRRGDRLFPARGRHGTRARRHAFRSRPGLCCGGKAAPVHRRREGSGTARR